MVNMQAIRRCREAVELKAVIAGGTKMSVARVKQEVGAGLFSRDSPGAMTLKVKGRARKLMVRCVVRCSADRARLHNSMSPINGKC